MPAPRPVSLQGCSPAPHSHVPDDPSQPLRFRAFYGHRLRRRQMLPDPNNPCQTGAGTQPGAPGDTPKSFLRSLLGAAHGTPTSWLPCAGLGGEKADPKYSARVLRAPRGPECPPKLSPELAACGQGEKQSHSRGMKGAAANTTPNFLLRGVSNGTGSSVSPWHGERPGMVPAQPGSTATCMAGKGPRGPQMCPREAEVAGDGEGTTRVATWPGPPKGECAVWMWFHGAGAQILLRGQGCPRQNPAPNPKAGPQMGSPSPFPGVPAGQMGRQLGGTWIPV